MEADSSFNLLDEGFSSSRTSMCDVLKSLIINNIEYFKSEKGKNGREFAECFERFLVNLNDVKHKTSEIARFAYEYDYDRSSPGNGYRSMISVVDSCVLHSIQRCRSVCMNRNSFMFRRDHFFKEIESYCDLLGCISVILNYTLRLRPLCEPRELFPSNISAVDFLLEADNIDTSCFYGRCLGFQFYDSMKKPLKFISLMMVSFSDAYYNTGGMVSRTASSVISCGKYLCSPELRAQRIVEVARKASVDFCKSFWLLNENQLMQHVPGLVCESLQVNKVLQVPVEPLTLISKSGTIVDIPIPESHLPTSPVICRLLSASLRKGQLTDEELAKYSPKRTPVELSPYLIIQSHGGGFVAQSSKSHEVYLRDWATKLDIPILCIDYSLAPEAPYPRALEECIYVYAWALKNVQSLGSTGEKICFVGDSAGGSLLTAVIMKSIELEIRLPDGFLCLYAPFLVRFYPSPSRLLCLMDPLLPFGFMMRCLGAYAGHTICDSNVTEDNLVFDDISREKEKVAIYSESLTDFDNVDDVSESSYQQGDNDDNQDEAQQIYGNNTYQVDLKKASSCDSNSPIATCDDSDRSSFEEVIASQLDEYEFAPPESRKLKSSDKPGTNQVENICNGPETKSDNKETEDYVSQFMDGYMSAAKTAKVQKEMNESDENVLFEMPIAFPFSISQQMGKLTDKVKNGMTSLFSNKKSKSSSYNLRKKSYNGIFADRCLDDAGSLMTLLEEFSKFTVDKDDPYLSPYFASDEILKKFPPINLLSTALDPCLDDCVGFSKRLKSLGCDVHLDILDRLPHGFLNLCLVSSDAKDGANVALSRIRKLLSLSEQDRNDGM